MINHNRTPLRFRSDSVRIPFAYTDTRQIHDRYTTDTRHGNRVETSHHVVGLRTREAGSTSDGMMSLRQIEVAS